jgi:hypothetical protein
MTWLDPRTNLQITGAIDDIWQTRRRKPCGFAGLDSAALTRSCHQNPFQARSRPPWQRLSRLQKALRAN